jgi:hypothetical protein
MKLYTGYRTVDGCVVLVDGHPLDLRLDVVNHSPTGFEWGYLGSGPSQLALAILLDHFGGAKKEQALWLYGRFLHRVVANFARRGFAIDSKQIELWIKKIEDERA